MFTKPAIRMPWAKSSLLWAHVIRFGTIRGSALRVQSQRCFLFLMICYRGWVSNINTLSNPYINPTAEICLPPPHPLLDLISPGVCSPIVDPSFPGTAFYNALSQRSPLMSRSRWREFGHRYTLDYKLSRDEGIPCWRHCWAKRTMIAELESHRKRERGCRGYYRARETDLEWAEDRD